MSRAAELAPENRLGSRTRTSTDEDSIRVLVEQHFDFIWRLFRRFGLSETDADDAAQQVFIVAARHVAKIEEGRERTFLYGTALRTLANHRRGQRRRREQPDDTVGEVASEAARPDELVETRRARAELDELLASMPERLRRVLVLAELEQASIPEIALHERIPTGTAASRLRKARSLFRELLAARP
ncbi:MAG TPA: sigma-70 family RNA polymerase sigma factor, partial [Polyangiaceae bacterium]